MRIDRNKVNIAKGRLCLTTKDMLKEAGVSQVTYSRGINHSTSPKTAGKIARALHVDVLDIIVDDMKPENGRGL